MGGGLEGLGQIAFPNATKVGAGGSESGAGSTVCGIGYGKVGGWLVEGEVAAEVLKITVGGAPLRGCVCRCGTVARCVACVDGSCMGWPPTAMLAWWGVCKGDAGVTSHACQCWQRGAAAAVSAVLHLAAACADAARWPAA